MKGSVSFAALLAATLFFLSAPAGAAPTLEWADIYDGGANYIDLGLAVLSDEQGNLVVGGESADGAAGSDLLIRKLSRSTAQTIWTRRYAAFDGNDMALSGMVWDPFGDILIGGYIRGCVG